jgi:hypothetical protein
MTDNWEFAVSKATGQFLIIFGDDDGLVTGSLARIFDIIQKTKTELVSWARVEYSWPDGKAEQVPNRMVIPFMATTGVVDSKTYINKVIRYKADYRYLPMFYNSAVDRRLVELLKSKSGRVFNASSPDLYTGYGFAHLLKKYITIGSPLAINGVSSTSNGAAHLNGDESIKAEYWKLMKDSAIKWPADLPGPITPYIGMIEPFMQLAKYIPELNRYISRKEIYKVIVDTLQTASEQEYAHKIKEILDSAKNDHQLYKWLEGYLRKVTPKIIPESSVQGDVATGFDGSHLKLDGSKFGLKNVYDVSVFIGDLLGNLRDADYLKPALPGLYKRVRKAAALVLRGV